MLLRQASIALEDSTGVLRLIGYVALGNLLVALVALNTVAVILATR